MLSEDLNGDEEAKRGKRIKLFTSIRDIPYRVNERSDEEDNSCDGKHRKLLRALTNEGYEVRWRSGLFSWRRIGILEQVAALGDGKNWMHVWLEVKIGENWIAIDATWDIGLQSILPVNDWDGVSDMPITVLIEQLFRPEETADWIPHVQAKSAIKKGLSETGQFAVALNMYLKSVRQRPSIYF